MDEPGREPAAANDPSPLGHVLADWCAANPRIRRAFAYERLDDDAGGPGASLLYILVDVEPVMDSEEILPVWLVHSGAWRLELQARTARTVRLDWLGPYEAARPGVKGIDSRSIGAWSLEGVADGP